MKKSPGIRVNTVLQVKHSKNHFNLHLNTATCIEECCFTALFSSYGLGWFLAYSALQNFANEEIILDYLDENKVL